jgi:hypothetical protein
MDLMSIFTGGPVAELVSAAGGAVIGFAKRKQELALLTVQGKLELDKMRLDVERAGKAAVHELEIARLRGSQVVEEADRALTLAQVQGAIQTQVAAYQHDESGVEKVSQSVADLRASVRPVLAYTLPASAVLFGLVIICVEAATGAAASAYAQNLSTFLNSAALGMITFYVGERGSHALPGPRGGGNLNATFD